MTPAALRGLAALAEAREARDLARLEGLVAADRALARTIADLAGVHARDMAEGAGAPVALYGRRLAWADAETARAHAARARLAPQIAAARAAATLSLGRRQALGRLLEGAERTARAAREARAEREAPTRIGSPVGTLDWMPGNAPAAEG